LKTHLIWSSLPLATTAILLVRFDNDPRHNLTDRGIGTANIKLEASAVGIRDRIHTLNQWR
jgi:hypothetical protein